MSGTVIKFNIITDEDFDVTVNTPGTVEVHGNSLLCGNAGVANICAFDCARAAEKW